MRSKGPSPLIAFGGGFIALGVMCGLVAFVWAFFWSAGFKGSTTEQTIHYNLSDPVAGSIAYGPLACSLLILLGGVGMVIAGVIRRARGPG